MPFGEKSLVVWETSKRSLVWKKVYYKQAYPAGVKEKFLQMDHHLDRKEQASESPFPEPEEEIIEWDGSEAEFVADEDAEEFEEQNTGIRLSYSVREKEALQCLLHTGPCRTTGRRAIVETAILGVLAVLFLVQYIVYTKQDMLFFAGISLLVIAVIWIVPRFALKKRAHEIAQDSEVHLQIYPDVIEVYGKGRECLWEIPLNNTCMCRRIGNLLWIHKPGGKSLLLPLRCVEPALLPEIQAMIFSGTIPDKR